MIRHALPAALQLVLRRSLAHSKRLLGLEKIREPRQRRCALERLESRQLMAAAIWSNVLQPLDVFPNETVSPLDALLIINEINSRQYSDPQTGKLPAEYTGSETLPMIDVTCDNFATPIDALLVINAINSGVTPPGWRFSAEGGSAQSGRFESSACAPRLVEGTSLVTQLQSAVKLPTNNSTVKVTFDAPTFDTTSQQSMRDAFEILIVDANQQPLALPFQYGQAASANWSEQIVMATAPGTLFNSNSNNQRHSVTVNLSGVAAGTVVNVVARLVNNDRDDTTAVVVRSVEVAQATEPAPQSLQPLVSTRPTYSAVNFNALSDVSSSLAVSYGRTTLTEDPSAVTSTLQLTNVGSLPIHGTLLAVFKNLSDPTAALLNPDGFTADGDPYLNLTNLASSGIVPGQTLAARELRFRISSHERFSYQLQMLSGLNHTPEVEQLRNSEVAVGDLLSARLIARDADGDDLAYRIANGPTGMQIDANGYLTWTPSSNDIGQWTIDVVVSDQFGAEATARWVVQVKANIPNRPPIITSTPNPDAVITSPFEVLTYATGDGPVAADVIPTLNGLSSVVTANAGQQQLGLLHGNMADLSASIALGIGEPNPNVHLTPFEMGLGVPLDLSPQTLNNTERDIQQVSTADVNFDSIPDLIVAATLTVSGNLYNSNDRGFVSVRLGNGDGTFRSGWQTQLPVVDGRSGRASTIRLADVTGDTRADLIVTTSVTNQTLVFAAKADGMFEVVPLVSANSGSYVVNMQIADLNLDGKLDLALFESEGGPGGGRRGIGIQLGDGTGRFSGTAFLAAANNNGGLGYAVDVDQANGPDLVRLNYNDSRMEVWLNDGTGNFGSVVLASVRAYYDANGAGGRALGPTSAIFNDYTGDGRVDALLTSSQSVVLLKGIGDGHFGDSTQAGNRVLVVDDGDTPQWVGLSQNDGRAFDYDGDGRLDFVFGDINRGGNVMVGLGQVDGSFDIRQYNAMFDDDIGIGSQRNTRSVPFVAPADFNLDGVMDLAVGASRVDQQPGSVGLLLGGHPGTLRAPSFVNSYASSNNSVERGRGGRSTAGDFNNDGFDDIVSFAGLGFGNAMFFAAGRGDGSFAEYVPALGGLISGNSITSLDIDRDGNLDIAWFDGSRLGAAFGLGNGAFQSLPALILDGSTPGVSEQALQVDDFNRDGYPDLVVRMQTGNIDTNFTTRLAVLLYNPTNRRYDRLADSQNLLTNTPRVSGFYFDESVGLGDLNNDGVKEFFTFSSRIPNSSLPARFTVFEQTGILGSDASTLFRKTVIENPSFIAADASIHSWLVADFDSDGHSDIAYSTHSARMVVSFGRGDFTYRDSTTYITNGLLLAGGDFNGDGVTDVASMWSAFLNFSQRPYASILLGKADGSFGPLSALAPTGESTFGPVVGDFNGDGIDDLSGLGGLKNLDAFVSRGPGLRDLATGDVNGDGVADIVAVSSDADRIKLLIGGVNDSFVRQADLFADLQPTAIELLDADGDDLLDILTANQVGMSLSLLTHAAPSVFVRTDIDLAVRPSALAVGDLDGDAKLDAVIISQLDQTLIGLKGVSDSLSVELTLPLGFSPRDIALGDVNGDGKVDAVLTDSENDRVVILLGKGDGTFLSPSVVPFIESPASVTLADMNGDGRTDLAVTQSTTNQVALLFNRGNGKFASPQLITVGTNPQSIRARDLNADGRPDLLVTNVDDNTLSVILNRFDPAQVWSYQPTAIDPDGDTVAFDLTSAPGGMILDSTSNIIYWAPMPEQIGRSAVVLTASDGHGGSTDQSFQVTVTAPVSIRPPVFTSTPVPAFDADTTYQYTPNIQTADAGPIRFTLVNAPAGMTVDPTTGAVQWDPRTNGLKLYANSDPAQADRFSNYGQFQAPDSPSLRSASITAEGWFYAVDPKGNIYEQLISKGTTGDRNQVSWGIEYFFGTLRAKVGRANGTDLAIVSAPAPVAFNRWTHVAMTFDDTTRQLTLLVDGQIVGTAISSEAIGYNATPFYAGRNMIVGSRVRVWNMARSAADIARDRLAEVPSDTAGLIMDLRFNESLDASTLVDASPSENHATLIGTPDIVNFPTRVPALANQGTFPVLLRVEDGRGGVAEQNFEVTVRLPYTSAIHGVVFDDLNGNGVWDRRADENLVINGNFNSGPIGFTTDLILRDDRTTGAWLGEYQATVSANAGAVPLSDGKGHTGDASDLMLVANGKSENRVAWRQTIPTVVGQAYDFSFWALRPNGIDAASVRVLVNGQSIGSNFSLSDVSSGRFKRYLQNFTANSNQSIIEIVLLGTSAAINPGWNTVENSVAIDDILLLPVEATRVIVPGTASPYLAGMPDGSTAFSSAAPANSPISLPVNAGDTLRLRATGSTTADGFLATRSPDGSVTSTEGLIVQNGVNGLSSFAAPTHGALIGVFLDDNSPSGQAPPLMLDFRASGNVADGINFASLQPSLRQVFFIGDGLTASGIEQTFTAPAGATRLFLANSSRSSWTSNRGEFEVQVFNAANEPAQAGRTVFVDSNLNNRLDAGETTALTDRYGLYRLAGTGVGTRVVLAGQSEQAQTIPALPYQAVLATANPLRVDFGSKQAAADHAPIFASSPLAVNNFGLTNANAAEVTAPGQFTYQAYAQSSNGLPVTYALETGPQGMFIDRISGLLQWNMTAVDAGQPEVILKATDSLGRFELQRFTLNVTINTAPVIVSPLHLAAQLNVPFEYHVLAQDAEQSSLKYELLNSSSGLVIDSTTGMLRWTPNAMPDVTATVRVSDGAGGVTQQALVISVAPTGVNTPPAIDEHAHNAIINRTFAARIMARDENHEPLSYSLISGPSGLTLSSDGVISWQPEQLGAFAWQARVVDSRGAADEQSFSIVVSSRSPANDLTISSSPSTAALVGTLYAYDVKSSGAVNFDLITRPMGMSIDTERGTVRWLPTKDQLGVQSVRIVARNVLGQSVEQSFNIAVRSSSIVPTIASAPPVQSATGQTYLYTVQIDNPARSPLVYSLPVHPDGMLIDPSAGVISWTPRVDQVGSATVVLRVADALGNYSSQSFAIEVAAGAANQPPAIQSSANLDAVVGINYQYTIVASDPESSAVTYAVRSAPLGFNVDSATGIVSWTPTASDIGTVRVLLTATDTQGGVGVQALAIDVRAANRSPEIRSNPLLQVARGGMYQYDVIAIDPDREPLFYSLVTAPSGMTIDALGRIRWQTSINAAFGARDVVVRAGDGQGGFVTQTYTLGVVADTQAPRLTIIVGGEPVLYPWTTAPAIVRVIASDNVALTGLELKVDGQPVELSADGTTRVYFTAPGNGRIEATATDAAGNVGRAVGRVNMRSGEEDGGGNPAPEANISSLGEGATVSGFVNVIGTAAAPDFDSYTLSYRRADQTQFQLITTSKTSVTNGSLGQWDTSLLQNDNYVLKLEVVDTFGSLAAIEIQVGVTGALKFGNFQSAFADITIPVNGIPITVTRSYDSLNVDRDSDFGYGWRLEYRNTKLSTSLPASGLEDIGIYTPFKPGTRVFLTLPGGKRESFTFTPEIKVLPGFGQGNNLVLASPRFTSDRGVTSTLSAGAGQLTVNEFGELFAAGGIPWNPANPEFGGYKLRTQSGITYAIGSDGQMQSATDRTGTKLDFTESGITSSHGQELTFQRDIRGRIRAISDPAGNTVQYRYSTAGDLIEVTDRNGATTHFSYASSLAHRLTEIKNADGKTLVKVEYDALGRAIRRTDGSGVWQSLSYSPDTRTVVETNTLGQTTSRIYNLDGNLVSQTDANGAVMRNEYDANGYLSRSTDPLGNQRNFVFDVQGNLLSETDPLGARKQYVYDNFGKLLAETDALGQTIRRSYDAQGSMTKYVTAAGKTTEYTYNSAGQITKMISPMGGVYIYAYNSLGQLTSAHDPSGSQTSFVYDANGQIVKTTIDYLNHSQQLSRIESISVFDASGNLTELTDTRGAVTRYQYDASNRKTAEIDAAGNRTAFTYDAAGRLIKTLYPDGTQEQTQYDELGRPSLLTDALGRVTKKNYDAIGHLIETILPDRTPQTDTDNPRTTNRYNLAGDLIEQTDELGNTTKWEVDAAGRRTRQINALNQATLFTYDRVGQIISTALPGGATTHTGYSADGEVILQTLADGSMQRTSYAPNGQPTVQIDANHLSTSFAYDTLGQLIEVVDPSGAKTAYQYDGLGNRVAQTDANGHTTRFEFDGSGKKTATVRPAGQRATYQYNNLNQLVSETDFNGGTTRYAYDAMGRIIRSEFPDGTNQVTTYNAVGLRTAVTEADGTTRYEYDTRDRIVSRTDPDGLQVTNLYDAAGQLVKTEFPGGEALYEFDALGRITASLDKAAQGARFTYDNTGNRVQTAFTDGSKQNVTYDPVGRVLTWESVDKNGLRLEFIEHAYDAAGQRVSTLSSSGRSVQFEYDSAGRLTRVRDGEHTNQYIYDAVGNRTSSFEDGAQHLFTYDSNDRLVRRQAGATIETFQFDPNGNQLESRMSATESTLYHYDSRQRLVSIKQTRADITAETTMDYDADGNRILQTTVDGSTRYLVDDNGMQHVLATYDDQSNLVEHYNWLDHILVQQATATERTFMHTDMLGSVVLTTQGGLMHAAYNLDEFGLVSPGADLPAVGYATGMPVPGTDLYYMRARYYDAASGRFLTTDPELGQVRDPITLHRYVYASSDPVNNFDPTGRYSLTELGGTLGTISLLSGVGSIVASIAGYQRASNVLNIVSLVSGIAGIGLAIRGVGVALLKEATKEGTQSSEVWATNAFIQVAKTAADNIGAEIYALAETSSGSKLVQDRLRATLLRAFKEGVDREFKSSWVQLFGAEAKELLNSFTKRRIIDVYNTLANEKRYIDGLKYIFGELEKEIGIELSLV